MNPQGTSFIPKRPTQGNIPKRGVRKVYILTYVSYILFFGTLLGAGGTFFYQKSEEGKLAGSKKTLELERTRFSEADIASVKELDARMIAAKERMDKHISVVSIFEALEKSALGSLQFTDFTYEREGDGAPLVTLLGTTEAFNSVMFQRDVLADNPILSGATFTEVSAGTPEDEQASDAEQVITFTIAKEVDTSLIQYEPKITTEPQTDNVSDETVISDIAEPVSDPIEIDFQSSEPPLDASQ